MTPLKMINNFVEAVNEHMKGSFKVTRQSRFSEDSQLALSYKILELMTSEEEDRVFATKAVEEVTTEIAKLAKVANLVVNDLKVEVKENSRRIDVNMTIDGCVVKIGNSLKMVDFGPMDNSLCFVVHDADHNAQFPTLESFLNWMEKRAS